MKDEDVTDLELKLEKGATITGVAKMEEGSPQNPKSNLSTLRFSATLPTLLLMRKTGFPTYPHLAELMSLEILSSKQFTKAK